MGPVRSILWDRKQVNSLNQKQSFNWTLLKRISRQNCHPDRSVPGFSYYAALINDHVCGFP